MLEITKSNANKCAEIVTETLKPVLRLENWKVKWRFESLDTIESGDILIGKAAMDYNHLRLEIHVDTFRHNDDLEDFVDTLRHEICHATHFMWSRLFVKFLDAFEEQGRSTFKSLWNDAAEQHVAYMGQLLDAVGYSIGDLTDICLRGLEE